METRLRDLLRRKPAAILQPAIGQQDFKTAFRQIRTEHQAMMTRADDDPVVISLERRRHDLETPRQNYPERQTIQIAPISASATSPVTNFAHCRSATLAMICG